MCGTTTLATTITGVQGLRHSSGILEHSPVSRWTEELEEAGGSWEAMLLAALSQLSKLLAMCTEGAAGTWRQLRRRRKVRQGRRGGRGGRAVQQWWRQLRSYVHQQRCEWMKAKAEAGVEELQGEVAGGAALEAAACTNNQGERRSQRLEWQQGVLLEMVACRGCCCMVLLV